MSPAPTPQAATAHVLALRKAYSISLYAVDCLRIGIALLPEAQRSKDNRYLAACMDSLADMQECIAAVFPNDKTLGD